MNIDKIQDLKTDNTGQLCKNSHENKFDNSNIYKNIDVVNEENIEINDILEPELDTGNIEYKSQLLNLCSLRKEKLATQLSYRLREGNGECVYQIGIKDNGSFYGLNDNDLNTSIANLSALCEKINACINYISIKRLSEKGVSIDDKKVAEVFIRSNYPKGQYIDIYISVVGNVDAGKSTLIGVLSKNILDNGRGKSRSAITNFKHEMESGRTSTSTHHIIGFDNNGNLVNESSNNECRKTWSDIVMESNKIITLNDLCGHEKYLRTTIFGVSSVLPDYCMVVVAANNGITHMTKEHMALAFSLKIPMFFVITKVDICPDNVYTKTKEQITRFLKLPGLRKLPYFVKSEEDIPVVVKNVCYDNCVPIFSISNVSGQNVNYLKRFLNLLTSRKNIINQNKYIEFIIDGWYMVTGVGVVVSGMLNSGKLKIGDNVLLGPMKNTNEYIKTYVRSIQIKRVSVGEVAAGTYCTLSLKKININFLRKGMVLISNDNPTRNVRKFTANINILQSHHTTIRKNYQPFLHIGCVRQSAKILDIQNIKSKNEVNNEDPSLRTGDRALLTLEFIYRGEYVQPGNKLIFREGKIRGVGIIQDILE